MRDINEIIDEAIEYLCDDDISKGGEALVELAHCWSKAGMTQQSFNDIRKYIIDEATAKTSAIFISCKLKIIERKMYEQRNRTDKGKAWTKNSGKQPNQRYGASH